MMKNSSPTQLNQIFNVLNENNKIMENSQKSACMAGLDDLNELEPTMFTHTAFGLTKLTPRVVFVNTPSIETHTHADYSQNQITSVQPAPTQIDSQDQNQVPLV
ncbi:hypothetical protein H5410_024786, partial [Solanum commersonii]